jgi:hypothetical protein
MERARSPGCAATEPRLGRAAACSPRSSSDTAGFGPRRGAGAGSPAVSARGRRGMEGRGEHPGLRRPGRHRSAGRPSERSLLPSPRPPAAQRARTLDARAQQFGLHAQLADPLNRNGKHTRGRIRLAFLQRAFQRGIGLPPPRLKLIERHPELAREEFHPFTAQQAQHHLALAPHAPALASRQNPPGRRSQAPPSHHWSRSSSCWTSSGRPPVEQIAVQEYRGQLTWPC